MTINARTWHDVSTISSMVVGKVGLMQQHSRVDQQLLIHDSGRHCFIKYQELLGPHIMKKCGPVLSEARFWKRRSGYRARVGLRPYTRQPHVGGTKYFHTCNPLSDTRVFRNWYMDENIQTAYWYVNTLARCWAIWIFFDSSSPLLLANIQKVPTLDHPWWSLLTRYTTQVHGSITFLPCITIVRMMYKSITTERSLEHTTDMVDTNLLTPIGWIVWWEDTFISDDRRMRIWNRITTKSLCDISSYPMLNNHTLQNIIL